MLTHGAILRCTRLFHTEEGVGEMRMYVCMCIIEDSSGLCLSNIGHVEIVTAAGKRKSLYFYDFHFFSTPLSSHCKIRSAYVMY